MKEAICNICLQKKPTVDPKDIIEININYYRFIEDFKLLPLCKECMSSSYSKYQNDLIDFLDWINENDNRSEDDVNPCLGLRKQFCLSEELLIDKPEEYLDNLEKYAIYLENIVLSAKEEHVNS